MKKLVLLLAMVLGTIHSVWAVVSVETKILDANSQPPLVGGIVSNYSNNIVKKGVIVSISNDNLILDLQSETSNPYFYEDLTKTENTYSTLIAKDFRVIDCSDIGKEQFWCPLLILKSNMKYYFRAYVVDSGGIITYGQIESLTTQIFNRYDGRADYANVWHSFDYTLFDLITDEIIDPNNGFYYSTNENPTTVRHQIGTSYNTCYKFLTEWNYKLWYYHSGHCISNKMVCTPNMTYENGKLSIEKNPLDADKDITIYYSINGNYFRPETYTSIYTNPIEISEPCAVYCYAISSDGYISYTNMYVIEKVESNDFGKVGEIVDLGLSVKWASWNVGAESPEEAGNYYAWGELQPKTNYSLGAYKFYNTNSFTKYGSIDNKYILDAEDDVAQQTWGDKWRIPTFEELKELKEKCTFTKTVLNGVPVTKVEGPNGNFIYFPYPGNFTGETLFYKNSIGSYWSSNLDRDDYAKDLDFLNSNPSLNGDYRYHGQSVRPVYGNSVPKNDSNNDTPVYYSRKIVMEEATGTWCGWCVRGIETIERVKEEFPDNFIAIALHSGDIMDNIYNYEPITSKFTAYPNCLYNRSQNGPSSVTLGGARYEVSKSKDNAIATINASATYTHSDMNYVNVTTQTTFGFNKANAAYRIAYVVVEDNVGPYMQRNSYSNNSNYSDPTNYMYGWYLKTSPVEVMYNDVARGIYGSADGEEGSVPSVIVLGETYNYDYTFALPDNIDNKNNIRIITLLLDSETGEIVNADQTTVLASDVNGIKELMDNIPTIRCKGNVVSITGTESGMPVIIYNTTGKVICETKATAENVDISVPLPAGNIAIVKIGTNTQKVLIGR